VGYESYTQNFYALIKIFLSHIKEKGDQIFKVIYIAIKSIALAKASNDFTEVPYRV